MMRTEYLSSSKHLAAAFFTVFSLFIFKAETVLALPAGQEPSSPDLTLSDDIIPISITNNSNFRSKLVWSNEPLNEQAVYVAVLHCTGIFVTKDAGKEIEAPGFCYRPGYGKVAVSLKGSPSSRHPNHISNVLIAAALMVGLETMVVKNMFYKLEVKIYEQEVFMGSVTYARFREPTGPEQDTVENNNILTSLDGADFQAWTAAPSVPGSLATGELAVIVRTQERLPPPRSIGGGPPRGPQVSVSREVVYTYSIKKTDETGLTLKAYTMAALEFFDWIADQETTSRDLVVEDVAVSPFQQPQLPGFDITILAGYKSVEERTAAPEFTGFSLVLAMVEVPLQLLGAKSDLDFFTCRVLADHVPVGDLWVAKGVFPGKALGVRLGGGHSVAKP